MIKIKFLGLSLILLFSGCGSFAKKGLEMSTPLIYQSSLEAEKEYDYKMMEAALPADLKLVEGLLNVLPENLDLLVTVIKSYTVQAYAFDEIKFLDEKWNDIDNGTARSNALFNYSKAIRYGQTFLKLHDLELAHLQKKINADNEIERLLSGKFAESDRDLEGVLFFAQALGGMINLNRDRMDYLSYLPLAKKMVDWVCKNKPDTNFGACYIFNGQYESSRPVMLGGNPAQGEQYFQEGINKFPENWLILESYLEHFLIPMEQKDKAQAVWMSLNEKQKELGTKMIWSPSEVLPPVSRINFFQALAIERFKVLKKYEKKIFSGM